MRRKRPQSSEPAAAPSPEDDRNLVVGLCTITLALHGNRSLKGKRRVVKSMKERVRGAFNASVAEVDLLDSLDRAVLGVSIVGNDRAFVNSMVDKVLNRVEGLNAAEIIDSRVEIMST